MSDEKERARAGLTAAEEALAAERKRHEAARAELAGCQAALDATDPDDRKALDRALAAHGAALARTAALAARETKAAAAVELAREAVAAVELAEVESAEAVHREEIEKAKRSAMAKLHEARDAVNAALTRLAQLGEPDEPMPGSADVQWRDDDSGRPIVTIRIKRAKPTRASPEPVVKETPN